MNQLRNTEQLTLGAAVKWRDGDAWHTGQLLLRSSGHVAMTADGFTLVSSFGVTVAVAAEALEELPHRSTWDREGIDA